MARGELCSARRAQSQGDPPVALPRCPPLPLPGEDDDTDGTAEGTTKRIQFLRPVLPELTQDDDDLGLRRPLHDERTKCAHHPRAVALAMDVDGHRVQDLDPADLATNPVPVTALTASAPTATMPPSKKTQT